MRQAEATSETVKDTEEVVTGSNQAYETVELRYSTGGRRPQAARDLHHRQNVSTTEEPVYETTT